MRQVMLQRKSVISKSEEAEMPQIYIGVDLSLQNLDVWMGANINDMITQKQA